MEAKQENRRVKLRLDHWKKDRILDNLNPAVETANRAVIPLMRELGFDATNITDVIRFTTSSDALKDDFVTRELSKSGARGERLKKIISEDISKEFEEAFLSFPYDDFRIVYPELVKMDDAGKLFFNIDDVFEAATVYVEGADLEAYDRHQAAVKAMNEFFKGRAPEQLYSYFISINGEIRAGTEISYKNFK